MDPEIKVITEENTKVFHTNGDVFVVESPELLSPISIHNNPMSVFNESGKIIGAATLELQGNKLVGDFFLDYSTPERLDIENHFNPVYPHLEFDIKRSAVTGGIEMYVAGIYLKSQPTADMRIGPL